MTSQIRLQKVRDRRQRDRIEILMRGIWFLAGCLTGFVLGVMTWMR